MQHELTELAGRAYVQLSAADAPLGTEEHFMELVALAWETGESRFLLLAGGVAPEFFDLNTGLAGAALQKLSNYELRLALVVPDQAALPERFKEFVTETNRGRTFGVFTGTEQAAHWLNA